MVHSNFVKVFQSNNIYMAYNFAFFVKTAVIAAETISPDVDSETEVIRTKVLLLWGRP